MLAGCGFHLRGYGTLACAIRSIYLQSSDPYGPLTKMIASELKAQGVALVQDPCAAPYRLELGVPGKSIQTSGFGFSNQVSVNTLTLSLDFRLLSKAGQVLIPWRTISSVRSFTINTNQALMGNVIPDTLIDTMRRDLSHQLIDQLNSWKIHEDKTRSTC